VDDTFAGKSQGDLPDKFLPVRNDNGGTVVVTKDASKNDGFAGPRAEHTKRRSALRPYVFYPGLQVGLIRAELHRKITVGVDAPTGQA
jgi:hypothetical protein